MIGQRACGWGNGGVRAPAAGRAPAMTAATTEAAAAVFQDSLVMVNLPLEFLRQTAENISN